MPVGQMNPERWQRIAGLFAEAGLLPPDMDVAPLLYRPGAASIPAWVVGLLTAGFTLTLAAAVVALRFIRLSHGLQQSEARFRTLVEESPVGIFRYGADLRIAYVNAKFAEIVEAPAERLVGLDMNRVDDHSVLAAIRAAAEGRPGHYEGPYRTTLSAKTIQVAMTCAPLRAAGGAVSGAIGIVEDITARVAAEGERRTLLEAVEQSPMAVLITDTGGAIRFVNRGFEANTGYAKDEVLGSNPRFLQGIAKRPEEYAELWRTIHGGATWSGEFCNRRKDGSLFWEKAVIAPVRNGHGDIIRFVGVKEDITEKKARDEELRRLVAHLTETNTELERFAYVASHDLREPLRTIASFTQLLQRRYQGRLDADADEFIGLIVGAASRMHALIGDLLTYSRITTKGSPFAPVDTASVCRLALDNLRESIDEAHARITVGPLPCVVGDEVQLMQLFQNLIGNAVKFRRSGSAPRIDVGWDGESFHVADDGIGIADSDQDVFEVFRRLHGAAAYPGTGIGLAICKRIVQRHYGRIWHQPRPGGGTEFRFTLAAGTVH
ncbi:MAG: PAS domain S-box protein [Magnetospirillum sp.]|nr:PAS domain S-box protein [Magnetospirillum sp.]